MVEVDAGDPFVQKHRTVLVLEEGRWTLPRPGGLCVCLERLSNGDYACDRYADRPESCREFEFGGENCADARKRVGLLPLPN